MHRSISIFESIDLFLDKFKDGEKYRVDHTRSSHGNTQTPVHALVPELNLWSLLHCFSSADGEAVSLVYALGGVNWIDKSPTSNATQATRK